MRALLAGAAARARFAAAAIAAASVASAAAQQPGAETVRPYLWQAGMKRSELGEVNVFRRFSAAAR